MNACYYKTKSFDDCLKSNRKNKNTLQYPEIQSNDPYDFVSTLIQMYRDMLEKGMSSRYKKRILS